MLNQKVRDHTLPYDKVVSNLKVFGAYTADTRVSKANILTNLSVVPVVTTKTLCFHSCIFVVLVPWILSHRGTMLLSYLPPLEYNIIFALYPLTGFRSATLSTTWKHQATLTTPRHLSVAFPPSPWDTAPFPLLLSARDVTLFSPCIWKQPIHGHYLCPSRLCIASFLYYCGKQHSWHTIHAQE